MKKTRRSGIGDIGTTRLVCRDVGWNSVVIVFIVVVVVNVVNVVGVVVVDIVDIKNDVHDDNGCETLAPSPVAGRA